MADLGTIGIGAYDAANSTVDGTVGNAPPHADWVIGTASESSYVHTNNNNSTDEVAYHALGDMPGDFGDMLTLSYNIRYLRSANGPDKTWDSLRIQIFQSDRSTPLTDEMTVASSITTTTATNSGATAFTTVVGSDSTTWDGAVIALWFYKTKVKGGETDSFRVSALDITGTYTAGAAQQDITPALASVTTAAVDPTITTGDVSITPALASITTTALAPTVTQPVADTDRVAWGRFNHWVGA